MESLESELARAKELEVSELAAAIESIGFECTRCGACCRADDCEDGGDGDGSDDGDVSDDGNGETSADVDPHTATVFPDEVRRLQDRTDYDWRDVARPMPYGLDTDDRTGDEAEVESGTGTGGDGDVTGSTFEWALQTDSCGDCTFYEETDGVGACTVHEDRPLICRTYPFSVALGGTSQPMGEAVDAEGMVRAHECEGLGRDISRREAAELASALKTRAVRELEEAIAVRDNYEPITPGDGEVVVHDSEGAKHVDGRPYANDE